MDDRDRLAPEAGVPRHFHGFDWIRGLAALAIVSCHLGMGTTDSFGTVACFGRTGRELFAAVSGFLLVLSIERREERRFGSVVLHRASTLLPAYVGWTTFYLVALALLDAATGVPSGYLAHLDAVFVLKAYLRGSAEVHLYFIPVLFASAVAVSAAECFLPAAWRRGGGYFAAGTGLILAAPFLQTWLAAFRLPVLQTRFAVYELPLFGFFLLGAGSVRLLRGKPEARLSRARRSMALLLPVLAVAFVLNRGGLAGDVADWALVCGMLLAFSSPAFPESRIGAHLAATSLVVYYVHPFLGRLMGIAARKAGLTPLDMGEAVAAWLLLHAVSLAVASAWLRLGIHGGAKEGGRT